MDTNDGYDRGPQPCKYKVKDLVDTSRWNRLLRNIPNRNIPNPTTIEEIYPSPVSESGWMIKVEGYPNFLDQNWFLPIRRDK